MKYNPHALIVRVDGSAPRNPGPQGGFGMLIEFPDHMGRQSETEYLSFEDTNIQRMELRAVIAALEYVREVDGVFPQALIVTDSLYVVENTNRVFTWKRNRWIKSDGTPVHNSDLWDKFLKTRTKIRTPCEIQWEEGKSSEAAREVDKLAKKAARSPLRRPDTGHVRGKLSRAKLRGVASRVPMGGDELYVAIYRKRPADRRGDVTQVYFTVCDDQLKPQQKCFAYASPAMSAQLSRSHFYRVRIKDAYIVECLEELVPT